jgi:hypothetical protein
MAAAAGINSAGEPWNEREIIEATLAESRAAFPAPQGWPLSSEFLPRLSIIGSKPGKSINADSSSWRELLGELQRGMKRGTVAAAAPCIGTRY